MKNEANLIKITAQENNTSIENQDNKRISFWPFSFFKGNVEVSISKEEMNDIYTLIENKVNKIFENFKNEEEILDQRKIINEYIERLLTEELKKSKTGNYNSKTIDIFEKLIKCEKLSAIEKYDLLNRMTMWTDLELEKIEYIVNILLFITTRFPSEALNYYLYQKEIRDELFFEYFNFFNEFNMLDLGISMAGTVDQYPATEGRYKLIKMNKNFIILANLIFGREVIK